MKIPTEDFTDKTLVINDTYGCGVREIVVLIMEVNKVADEVADMVNEIMGGMGAGMLSIQLYGIDTTLP